MDSRPLLLRVAKALQSTGLEAVLIGNAAAALHGAPVTTLDFDFMFRDTPNNRRKLKRFGDALGAMVLRPYYPVSGLFRVVDDGPLQVDFLSMVHGVRSFEGLRSRSVTLDLGGATLTVASLADIVKSKQAAGRPRDLAVLEVLRATLEEIEKGDSEKPKSRRPSRASKGE